jgi:hypothetical protein
VAFLPAVAPAAGKRRVAVLDLVTDGMAADVRAQFETLIEEQLRRSGYLVIAHATVAEAVTRRDDLVEGCAFGPCVAPIAQAVGAERLLDVRITAEGPSYSFVVSMVESAYGATVAQEAASCGVCTVTEALAKLGASIAALENQRVVARNEATGRIVRMEPAPRSKALPIALVITGLAMTAGGTGLVAETEQKEAGWVTVGSGGTLLLTGLIMLLSGD